MTEHTRANPEHPEPGSQPTESAAGSDNAPPADQAVQHPGHQLTVDATGLACPLPILRAKKALAQLVSEETLQVITTDRGAIRDFQAFCRQTGNALLAQIEEPGRVVHYIKRR